MKKNALTPQEAAHKYALQGWRVIPITPGKKHPPIKAWQHAATTNPATIKTWWEGPYRDYGVGIVTGKQSGIWVLDVDDLDALHELELEHGALPSTLTSITGSGGEHHLYTWPEGEQIRNSASAIITGIDVRAEGGLIVAPPTVHPNGTRYAWELNGENTPAEAPPWLLNLLKPPPPQPAPAPVHTAGMHPGDRPGDLYAQQTDWATILTPDGWTLDHTDRRTGERHWIRPGKTEGTSATTGHTPNDNLHIFTSSLTHLGLKPEETYTKLGYLAEVHHHGQYSEAAQHLANTGHKPPPPDPHILDHLQTHTHTGEEEGSPHKTRLQESLVNWAPFFQKDHAETEWMLDPLLAEGRAHAIYAGAKVGKSYTILAACAALATGRPFLNQPAGTPRHVLYLDYEMTEADLHDRMTEFGYDEHSDLSHLHYALLPNLAPLDTAKGGTELCIEAEKCGAELVIIDTTGRSVEGDENDANTYQDFYRHTGIELKRMGITWARLDHSGKDAGKGQRGSSAKNDDVDVVIKLARTQSGITWEATHRRMSWYPESTQITIGDLDGQTIFTMPASPEEQYEPHIFDISDRLEHAGIPRTATRQTTRKALTELGITAQNSVLSKVLKWRKSVANQMRTEPADRNSDQQRTDPADRTGPDPENHTNKGGPPSGPPRTGISSHSGPPRHPVRGAGGPDQTQTAYEEF